MQTYIKILYHTILFLFFRSNTNIMRYYFLFHFQRITHWPISFKEKKRSLSVHFSKQKKEATFVTYSFSIYKLTFKQSLHVPKAGAKLQFLKSEIDAWLMGETIGIDESDDEIRIPVKARKGSSKKGGSK